MAGDGIGPGQRSDHAWAAGPAAELGFLPLQAGHFWPGIAGEVRWNLLRPTFRIPELRTHLYSVTVRLFAISALGTPLPLTESPATRSMTRSAKCSCSPTSNALVSVGEQLYLTPEGALGLMRQKHLLTERVEQLLAQRDSTERRLFAWFAQALLVLILVPSLLSSSFFGS